MANMSTRMNVQISPFAVETVWNFKPSKNRSRRVHKKLIKRHGQQSYERPSAIFMDNTWVVHPDIFEQLESDGEPIRLGNPFIGYLPTPRAPVTRVDWPEFGIQPKDPGIFRFDGA